MSRRPRLALGRLKSVPSRVTQPDKLLGELRQQRSGMDKTELGFRPSFDPFAYTRGRWLDRDSERRRARHVDFDFKALMKVAVRSCPGARRVVDCEKREGSFNKAFMIRMDNGAEVVARLPTRIAGPRKLMLCSEVATIEFVQQRTSVPVPRILDWNADASNPVGAEYTIMTTVPGISLMDNWSTMSGSQHIACIESMGKLMRELCSVNFPAYGSLFFRQDGPVDSISLDDTFCIGPHTAPSYWPRSLSTSKPCHELTADQGPWRDLAAYFAGLFEAARATVLSADEESQDRRLPYEGTAEDNLRLLSASRELIDILATAGAVRHASLPTLFHPDFHTRNIFVDHDDPTKITGIIDWQNSAVEPAFRYVDDTPDFAEERAYDEGIDGKRNTSEAGEVDKAEMDAILCEQAWTVMLQACLKVNMASRLDQVIIRALTSSHTGWTNSAAAVRSLLADLSEHWLGLDLPGACPYQVSAEQGDLQARHFEDMENSQRLRMFLARALRSDSDGWIEAERWEEVLPEYRRLFREWMDSAASTHDPDNPMSLTKAQKLWPFDGR